MRSLISLFVGFCAGFCVGCAVGYGRQGKSKPRSTSPSPIPCPLPSGSQDKPIEITPVLPAAPMPGEEWFRGQMKAYEDALLAYFISKYCLEKKVSAAKTMELYKQYGRVPLQPALTEFEAGFREQGLSVAAMGKFALEWLGEQGIEASMDNWEEKTTAFLEERQMKKAETIVNGIL